MHLYPTSQTIWICLCDTIDYLWVKDNPKLPFRHNAITKVFIKRWTEIKIRKENRCYNATSGWWDIFEIEKIATFQKISVRIKYIFLLKSSDKISLISIWLFRSQNLQKKKNVEWNCSKLFNLLWVFKHLWKTYTRPAMKLWYDITRWVLRLLNTYLACLSQNSVFLSV